MEEERVWPYVLPFPLEPEKRKLIWSILQSRVGMSILMKMKVGPHLSTRPDPRNSLLKQIHNRIPEKNGFSWHA